MNRATSATGWVRNPDGTLGWTWNPLTGCLNHVSGLCKGGGFPCYAYKLANGRLKQRYLANNLLAPRINFSAYDDPFYPRFWEERLQELIPPLAKVNYERYGYQCRKFEPYRKASRKPKGVFVCDMGDLFGVGVPEMWTSRVLLGIAANPQDRFYLLTKQPQNLPREFPDNCWVGVTATGYWKYVDACNYLSRIEAKVKFLSIEPLLSWDKDPAYFFESSGVSWLILGACTGFLPEMVSLCDRYPFGDLAVMRYGNKFTAQPKIEWVREIVEAADKAGVKVFQKDNLRPLLIPEDCSKPNYLTEDVFWASEKAQLRQELPNGK